MARFEDRLWSELVEQHGALLADAPARMPASVPARRLRRGPVAALAAALAAAIAAIVIGLVSQGGSAYAVVTNPDGTVTVTISELVGVGPADQRLTELGLPVRVVPVQDGCPVSRARLPSVQLPPDRSRKIFEPTGIAPGDESVRIDPAAVPRGDTLLLSASEQRHGSIALRALLIEGAAPTCVAPAPGE